VTRLSAKFAKVPINRAWPPGALPSTFVQRRSFFHSTE